MDKVETLKIKQLVRDELTTIFLHDYLPAIHLELERHMKESIKRIKMIDSISEITGKAIGVKTGEFKIGEPTIDLIESILDKNVHQN